MTTELDHVRQIARKLIGLGWKIVPIKKGMKFPAHIKQWQKLNITIDQIDEYFQGDCTNIGILTSPDTFVVDLDMNPWGNLDWKGKTEYPWGDEEWEELPEPKQKKHREHKYLYDYEQKYGNTNHFENGQASSPNTYQKWLDENNDGKPLNTPTSRTGSGGMQIFVKLSEGVTLTQSSKSIHPSIDTRTKGGQVVISPSIHPNGKKYEWLITPGTPIIDCPEWLLAKLQGPNWRDEFREVQYPDEQIEKLWEERKIGGAAKELAESDGYISSGAGRKRALCSIAGYWSNQRYSGEGLVKKVLPHLSRMEQDSSDPVDEKRVRAICRWVDGKNWGRVGKARKSQTTDILDEVFGSCGDFPIDSLPEVAQQYVANKSEQLGVPYGFFGGGVLCVFAGAIGTTYGIQLNNSWQEPCILWHVVLAETGVRKTSCFKAVWNIAGEKERQLNQHNRLLEKLYQKEKAVYERQIVQSKNDDQALGDPPDAPLKRILKISDATYESIAHILSNSSSGTSIFRPEILGWIEGSSQYAKGKNGSRAFYLESYDSGSYTMTRVGAGEKYIHRNHLNIWGFSQTKSFNRILSNEANVDDGFTPRFLICNPGPFPISSNDIASDTDSLEKLRSIYSDLVDIEPEYKDKQKRNPITDYLRFDKKAQEEWGRFHKHYEEVTNKFFVGKNHPFMPWWNKYPGQLARLTLVIHIIRWKSGEASSLDIDAVSLKKGVSLGKFFLSNAYQTVMGRNQKNSPFDDIPHQKEYQKIVRWVRNNKLPMDIMRMIRNRCFKNKSDAQVVLDEWVNLEIGILIGKEKTQFVPLCSNA